MAKTEQNRGSSSIGHRGAFQRSTIPHYTLHYKSQDNRAESPGDGVTGVFVPRRLIQREGIWHYYRRVPRRFADVDPRTFVTVSLETRDLGRAERIKSQVEKEVEAYWIALKKGESDDARERYLGALERARLEGFEYRRADELAGGSVDELLNRIDRLEEMVDVRDGRNEPPTVTERQAVEALLGGADMPPLTLSRALEQFEDFVRDRLKKKSRDQMRRWRAPRTKAINNMISLVGDKRVDEVTRADALALRRFWVERVSDHGYTPNSANKDIGHLAQILDTLSEALELGLGEPFAKLRLRDDKARVRPPFPLDQLRAIATDPTKLAGLNAEARGIVLAMVETGARPIELCGLEAPDIVIEAEIPHLVIRPGERDLKTRYSERAIPLVGVSLAVFREARTGFPRYRDKSSQLSGVVNKYLEAHDLLPTDDHSLYSIRHTFQDRLTAADMPDRVQADLMGHKFDRPAYGEGPTLEHKRDWLTKLAIT
ncbi:DUF6538 domain-containing protein [Bauldia sp.]|uniref:DUF6538 domain-containing protein n=1 Tax=Bauldia sp. TaxID=2575872 RepID=UPI003BAC7838